jgi:2-polyprenyl-6-methoxyphenol hydroxylase-like FAD-dependent oxidoreductase
MSNDVLKTTCCIVGGGPAGVMLGYLLARRGVKVTVLEKHQDFFRDFRGDTVHPSTLEVMHELGLLEDLLKVPHQKVTSVSASVGDYAFQVADVSHVPGCCQFVALMPQWDFLKFLSEKAGRFPNFELRMQHAAVDLIRDGARIAGVLARGPENSSVSIGADLVIGCDGRHSITRQAARLELREFGVPIDVLWFRISRKPFDPEQVFGSLNYGKGLVLINRGDYFQAGLIIRKGSFDEIKDGGLDALREIILRIAPFFGRRVEELREWDQIKLLTVQINRLQRWYREGLLCIGDAAHAMSPAGGVGINLAIQDAVATANLLTAALLRGSVGEAELASIQKRREFPTRVTQAIQVNIHNAFARVFEHPGPLKAPWQLKVAVRIPGIHRALGYMVGIGVRPEHVHGAARRRSRISGSAFVIGVAAGVAAAAATLIRRSRQVKRAAQVDGPRGAVSRFDSL